MHVNVTELIVSVCTRKGFFFIVLPKRGINSFGSIISLCSNGFLGGIVLNMSVLL